MGLEYGNPQESCEGGNGDKKRGNENEQTVRAKTLKSFVGRYIAALILVPYPNIKWGSIFCEVETHKSIHE